MKEAKNIREIPQRYEFCLMDEKLKIETGKIYFKVSENKLSYIVRDPNGREVDGVIEESDEIKIPNSNKIEDLEPIFPHILEITSKRKHTIPGLERRIINLFDYNYSNTLEVSSSSEYPEMKKKYSSFMNFFNSKEKIVKPPTNRKVKALSQIKSELIAIEANKKLSSEERLGKIRSLLEKFSKEFPENKGNFKKVLEYALKYVKKFHTPLFTKNLPENSDEFRSISDKLQAGTTQKYQSSRFESARITRLSGADYVKQLACEVISSPYASGGEDEVCIVEKVEFVNNDKLTANYEKRKAEIKKTLEEVQTFCPLEKADLFSEKLDADVNELFLYRGTSGFKTDIMFSNGFDSKYCAYSQLTGFGPLGRGTYFTDNLSKATNFSKCDLCDKPGCQCKDFDGREFPKVMLISKVIVGDPHVTTTKSRAQHFLEKAPQGKHSMIGLSGERSEFRSNEICVEGAHQILPYYRVYYRQLKNFLNIDNFHQEAKRISIEIAIKNYFPSLVSLIAEYQTIASLPFADQHVECLNTIKNLVDFIQKNIKTLNDDQKNFLNTLVSLAEHFLRKNQKTEHGFVSFSAPNPDEKVKTFKTFKTSNDGDCALHAIFGKWDTLTEEYVCADALEKRKIIKETVTDCKSASLRDLIITGVRELVTSTEKNIGKALLELREKYSEFSAQRDILINQAWEDFEKMLENKDCKSIVVYIRENHGLVTDSSLHSQLQAVLNKDSGKLKSMLKEVSGLLMAFEKYEEVSTTSRFDWLQAVEEIKGVRENYAAYLGTPGRWVSASEMAILAGIFDKTIIYYPHPNAEPMTINPDISTPVTVAFNGINHFERVDTVTGHIEGILGTESEIPARISGPADKEKIISKSREEDRLYTFFSTSATSSVSNGSTVSPGLQIG